MFLSQNDCLVYLLGDKFGAQSQIFSCHNLYQEIFDTVTSGVVSEQLLFLNFKSHTYNYLVKD